MSLARTRPKQPFATSHEQAVLFGFKRAAMFVKVKEAWIHSREVK
jgi:hypothetical protein